MSHVVELKTSTVCRNLDLAEAAAHKLGLDFRRDTAIRSYYGNEGFHADAALRFGSYDLGFRRDGADSYSIAGDLDELRRDPAFASLAQGGDPLGRFWQAYVAEEAKEECRRMNGHVLSEETEDGWMVVTAQIPD